MKIALDISALNKKSTGTGKYINCLKEQLDTFDHQIIKFPLNESSLGNNIFVRNYYKNFILSKEIEHKKVDCGIFPNYFIPSNFIKPSAIVIHDLSFITHPHFYSKRFVYYYSYMLKKTLRKNPLILTVSRHSKNQIVKHLNIREKNIFLLQGYFDSKFKNYPLDSFEKNSDPYFLYVGHIEPRKNLLFLVDNFLNWKNRNNLNYKLQIAGELWINAKETKILLQKYNNHPDIVFTGYVDDLTLHKIYSRASAFVHTSFEEGFGFPVLEAMHYNLPILCPNIHAAKEISSPHSININPYNAKSLMDGFDLLHEKVKNKTENYDIKYSPELMRKQLKNVLDLLQERSENKYYRFTVPKVRLVEEAIAKTLLYSGMFNCGIKKDSLHNLLFDVKVKKDELEKYLIDLYLREKILIDKGNVYLNSQFSSLFNSENFYRKSVTRINPKKIKRSIFILNHLPFISGIFFSGGTANYGIENHNDIDLFIITKPNAVYPVYLLIHLLSKLFKIRNELCANYLIDENNLEITQRDYYTAHQIVSLKTMKNNFMLKYFTLKNNWIKTFFPNFELTASKKDGRIFQKFHSPRRIYSFLLPVNKIIMLFYKWLYQKQLTSSESAIYLDDACIRLHTNDHRIKILENFSEQWKRYKKESDVHSIKTSFTITKAV